VVPQLEASPTDPEPVSVQAERLLYYALVGALEAGLVRTAENALTVLRQASQPLGPMGGEFEAAGTRTVTREAVTGSSGHRGAARGGAHDAGGGSLS
jgi:hypothetical protein